MKKVVFFVFLLLSVIYAYAGDEPTKKDARNFTMLWTCPTDINRYPDNWNYIEFYPDDDYLRLCYDDGNSQRTNFYVEYDKTEYTCIKTESGYEAEFKAVSVDEDRFGKSKLQRYKYVKDGSERFFQILPINSDEPVYTVSFYASGYFRTMKEIWDHGDFSDRHGDDVVIEFFNELGKKCSKCTIEQ